MIEKNLIVGNSSIDNVIFPDGTFYRGICGGNGFHSSMAASILSKDVALLSTVPSNFPLKYLKKLSASGIDISGVAICDKSVECEELFVYESNGDRQDGIFICKGMLDELPDMLSHIAVKKLCSCDAKGYSFKDFHNEFKPNARTIPAEWDIRSVHLAPTALDVCISFLDMKIETKTLDPGKYLIGMQYERVVELVSKTTVFAPSQKEMSYIFPGLSLFESVARLGIDGRTSVVCKNGGNGSVVYDAFDGCVYSVGVFPSASVDFTGAGDSFCGALSVCLSNGFSIIDSVRKATVVASKAIETVSAVERNKIGQEFVEKHYMDVVVNKEFST